MLPGQNLLRRRYPLAAGAGLALAAAFPNIGIAGFAWIAPALLLASAYGKSGGDAFRIGYVGGLVFFLVSLEWLLRIPATGFQFLAWLALSAFMGCYPGVWVWLLAGKIGHGSWARRLAWTLLGAGAWVALEMLRSRFLSGFPWNLLGNSQFRQLPLIQLAAYAGVYGVAFLIVWTSLSILSATLAILRQPTIRYIWLGDMLLPLLTVLGCFVFGTARLRALRPEGRPTLHATFIQPSIPQTMIWRAADNQRRFAELVQLTKDGLTNTTDLILWPEAAVPKMIRYDDVTLHTITALTKSNHVWMIVGSDDAEPAQTGRRGEQTDYFNASFLISPDGQLMSRYCKRKLVIFGEYVPLSKWLPFVKWLTPIDSGFVPGDRIVPFELERRSPTRLVPEGKPELAGSETGVPVKTATLICFEDVFPHIVPEYVNPDTDFLINLTNDGWFGEGGEQWQHAASAVFRAVENGVPLLRCCNNGITCWIDGRGVLQQVFQDVRGDVHGPGVMTAQIPVLAPGEKRTPTFYNQHGDWFGWVCVASTACVLSLRLRKWLRLRSQEGMTIPSS